mmetsp:Transcript_9396/g.20583  ORF Transcript_9396/g.20583 Transcript_9396/m.20583 type:complete len:329 (+) Transcript_9396:858-1844(+)
MVILARADTYEPTLAALALTYSYLMPYFLMVYSAISSFLRNCLTALERVLEYRGEAVDQEQEWVLASDRADSTLATWPQQGVVVFDRVTLVYRANLPPAITEISFTIQGGERVGIIGRTGAGKSSLLVLLFRIREPTSGAVLIDGRDVTSVGLQTLRKRMSVLPQEPLLLSGTVRENVDPFGEYREEDVRKALVTVGLGEELMDTQVGDSGKSISSGQAQLVGFARTILCKQKLVIMDEPTSNIDMNTDEAIQRVVRTAYSGATLLTIAHRLNTVIDSDRLLVMAEGRVAEFDAPARLLARPDSYLSGIVQGLGQGAAQRMVAKAGKA